MEILLSELLVAERVISVNEFIKFAASTSSLPMATGSKRNLPAPISMSTLLLITSTSNDFRTTSFFNKVELLFVRVTTLRLSVFSSIALSRPIAFFASRYTLLAVIWPGLTPTGSSFARRRTDETILFKPRILPPLATIRTSVSSFSSRRVLIESIIMLPLSVLTLTFLAASIFNPLIPAD